MDVRCAKPVCVDVCALAKSCRMQDGDDLSVGIWLFFGVVICIELCFFLYVVGRKSNCKIQLLSYALSSHLISSLYLSAGRVSASMQKRTHEPCWAGCEAGSWQCCLARAAWIKSMVGALDPDLV